MKRSRSKLIEEIKIFIEYSVIEEEREAAVDFLEEFKENSIVLRVIKDFYSRLPEFRQEGVCGIDRIVSRHDSYLLGVNTKNYEYLYLYNDNEPLFLGEKKDGIGHSEVLGFFGYSSNEDFLKNMEEQNDNGSVPEVFCPACAVAEGEIHLLGCPVEICPWCDGQFNYCNCRFEMLGVDEIEDENQIDRLEVILNEKGRIPFSASHAPAYPDGGNDD